MDNDTPEQSGQPPTKKRFESFDFGQDREWVINHGYSRFIRFFKKFMVIIALGVMLAFGLWMNIYDPDEQVTPQTRSQAENDDAPTGRDALIRAQYDGMDVTGRSFRITADRASRDSTDENRINMINPMADIIDTNNQWMAVFAETGFYLQENEILTLAGSGKLFYDEGVEFSFEQAIVNLKDSSVHTTDPVEGQSPDGRITGQGMRIEQAGQMIIFNGPATLQLRTPPQ